MSQRTIAQHRHDTAPADIVIPTYSEWVSSTAAAGPASSEKPVESRRAEDPSVEEIQAGSSLQGPKRRRIDLDTVCNLLIKYRLLLWVEIMTLGNVGDVV